MMTDKDLKASYVRKLQSNITKYSKEIATKKNSDMRRLVNGTSRQAAFDAAAPTLKTIEELDNAWKCLGLHYLGMREEHWIYSASIVMQFETDTFLKREEELIG